MKKQEMACHLSFTHVHNRDEQMLWRAAWGYYLAEGSLAHQRLNHQPSCLADDLLYLHSHPPDPVTYLTNQYIINGMCSKAEVYHNRISHVNGV